MILFLTFFLLHYYLHAIMETSSVCVSLNDETLTELVYRGPSFIVGVTF